MGSARRRSAAGLAAALVLACLSGLLVAATYARVDRVPAQRTVYTVPAGSVDVAPLQLPANPRVLLVGDSYSEGWGADPESAGFAFHVAEPLGWRLTRDGVGSTAFTNPGLKDQGSYATRLRGHPRDAYDLVVLQGGTNDERLGADAIAAGVDATVQVARSRFPHAQLLVMGPVSPYGAPSDNRTRLNLVLASYTHEHGLPYINPIAEHWFLAGEWRTLVNQSKGHPNNEGYARVARLFVRDVQELGAPTG